MTRKARKEYPGHRKYQGWQLKDLLRVMEIDINYLTEDPTPTTPKGSRTRLKEMFDEISLRLD
jgi:hypothetical protein